MITIETSKGFSKFPTSFDEITSEFLSKLSNPIKLGKEKLVIALCQICNLYKASMRVDAAGKIIGKPEKDIKVIPFICKANTELDFEIGSVAVIAVSELERANHINAPLPFSEVGLYKAISNNDDFRKAILRKEIKDDNGESCDDVIAISLIVVPTFNVAATIPLHYSVEL